MDHGCVTCQVMLLCLASKTDAEPLHQDDDDDDNYNNNNNKTSKDLST